MEEITEPIWEVAGFEYTRCPVSYQVAGAMRLRDMYKSGAMGSSFDSKLRWPAKRLAALMFIDFLKQLESTRGN